MNNTRVMIPDSLFGHICADPHDVEIKVTFRDREEKKEYTTKLSWEQIVETREFNLDIVQEGYKCILFNTCPTMDKEGNTIPKWSKAT